MASQFIPTLYLLLCIFSILFVFGLSLTRLPENIRPGGYLKFAGVVAALAAGTMFLIVTGELSVPYIARLLSVKAIAIGIFAFVASIWIRRKKFREVAPALTKFKDSEDIELEQLRQIFNNVNELIWILELGPGIPYFSFVSANYEKQLGKSDEPILGMPITRFVEKYIHEDDRHIYARRDTERRENKPAEFVTRIRPAGSNEIRWMRVRTFPIREKDGSYKRSVALVEDITEKKMLEEKLEKERTMQVQSAKLASIGILAAGVAHEINNPLQIIKNSALQLYSPLDPSESLPESSKAIGRSIDNSIEHISSIVKSLLMYARSNLNDQMQIHPLSVPMTNALSLLKAMLSSKKIDLQLTGEQPDKILINCLPGQIVQVIHNILLNAVDALEFADQKVQGDSPWINIDVALRRDQQRLVIKFANSGPRIEQNVAENLAVPFFTTKTNGKGTGLGLFISKNIIEAHKGSLRYDDSHEHTTFIVELPVQSPATSP